MAATYEPIASTVVSSSGSDVTFTSIPSTYTDLVIVATGVSNTSGSSTNGHLMQINGDTSTNYSTTRLSGDSGGATSNRGSNEAYIYGADIGQASGTISTTIWQVMSYANTNVYKTVLVSGAHPSVVRRAVGLWRSTSAITSIKVYRGADGFSAGYTISLYGTKAA